MNRPVALRLPKPLVALVDMKARSDRTDKATALRQMLYHGAEEFVLSLLARGRISFSRAAELLEVSHWDLHRLAEEKGVEIGPTLAQFEASVRIPKKL